MFIFCSKIIIKYTAALLLTLATASATILLYYSAATALSIQQCSYDSQISNKATQQTKNNDKKKYKQRANIKHLN